jgi:hypothetical protein
MITASVRDFRDRATQMLKQREPVMITRHGKVVGFFMPATGEALPLEIKRDLFYALTDSVRLAIKDRGLTEEGVLADFEKTRAARRGCQSHSVRASGRKRKTRVL